MRAPARVHALIVLGRFDRLRIFGSRRAAEAHRQAQLARLRNVPEVAAVWEEAETVSYKRVQRK